MCTYIHELLEIANSDGCKHSVPDAVSSWLESQDYQQILDQWDLLWSLGLQWPSGPVLPLMFLFSPHNFGCRFADHHQTLPCSVVPIFVKLGQKFVAMSPLHKNMMTQNRIFGTISDYDHSGTYTSKLVFHQQMTKIWLKFCSTKRQ